MEKSLKLSLVLAAPFLCIGTAPAFAQQTSTPPATVTMQVLEEGEDTDELFERIELPEDASEQARESAQQGLDIANAARAGGREFGQAVAEEARQRGGAETADEARASARDQMGDDIARGDLENLPQQARDNIPEEVKERIRNRPGRGGRGGGN